MKRKIKNVLVLCGILSFGAAAVGGMTSCQPEETVSEEYSITLDTSGVSVPSGEITFVNLDGESVTKAEAGEKITIYVTYDDKEIDTVTLNGGTLVKDNNGNYSFIMPESNAIIKISFKDETAEPEPEPVEETYNVTIDSGDVVLKDGDVKITDENGTVLSEIKANTKVYVSISNDYEVSSLNIDGVTVTKEEDGRYSFLMPEKDVVIVIDFVDYYTISVDTNGENVEEDAVRVVNAEGVEVSSSKEGEALKVIIDHTLPVSEVTMNETKLTVGTDGTYSFVMPAEAITISIDWAKSGELGIEADIDFLYFTQFRLTYFTGSGTDIKLNEVPSTDIDFENKKIKLDYNVEYTLHLRIDEGYEVTSVKLDDSLLTLSDGYTFTFTKDSKKISIETEEVEDQEPEISYTISFDPGDTGINPETVTFLNTTNNDLENAGYEGDTIWVYFYEPSEELTPEKVFANGVECTLMPNMDTQYTLWSFTMPAENVVITAQLASSEEPTGETTIDIIDNSDGALYLMDMNDGLFKGDYSYMGGANASLICGDLNEFPYEIDVGETYSFVYSYYSPIKVSGSDGLNITLNQDNGGYGYVVFTVTSEGNHTLTVDLA